MGLLREIQKSFSWPLALGFIGIGVVVGVAVQLSRSDFDRRGFVESRDGLRLAYEVQGEGPPLILLAGGPGISHHGFHPYLGLLRGQATIIYFDPRGRGDSETAPTYTVADDVSDVGSLVEGLGYERVGILGVSYGAHLAVAFAVERPRAVHHLILVSPVVGRSAWEAHLNLLIEAPGMDETLLEIRSAGREVLLSDFGTREEIVRTVMPLYWCRLADGRRQTSPWRPRHWVARQNFGVYEAIVGRPFGELNGDLAGSTLEERLGEIRAPTLVIQGECDRVIPAEHVDWLVGRLPLARRIVLPAGHSPFADHPRLFAETVGRFLAEVSDSAGGGSR